MCDDDVVDDDDDDELIRGLKVYLLKFYLCVKD